jgi:hypothetical protein
LREQKKGRERLKITLIEIVKNDMSIEELTENMILDKIEWWKKIHVADSD